LGRQCEEKPDKDVRHVIRQGGYSFLGLGLALLGFFIWTAMPYFRGESCNMATIGLVLGAPAVAALWICGVAALIVSRR